MQGTNIATKTCTKCLNDKSIDEFAFQNKLLNRRHSVCKECLAKNSKEWYSANRVRRTSQIAEQRLSSRAEVRQYVLDYLLSHPCVDCGESDPVVLDFDHVRGQKVYTISQMISRGVILSRVVEEIEKGEVRCANCHRIKTAQRRNY